MGGGGKEEQIEGDMRLCVIGHPQPLIHSHTVAGDSHQVRQAAALSLPYHLALLLSRQPTSILQKPWGLGAQVLVWLRPSKEAELGEAPGFRGWVPYL